MALLKRVLRALPLLLISPLLVLVSALALAVTDVLAKSWPGKSVRPECARGG